MGSSGWLLEVSSGPVEDGRGRAYGRESLQRAFSLLSDVPLCALSIGDWLCLSLVRTFWRMFSFCLPGIWRVCIGVCVWEASRFNPVMLSSGFTAVPLCRKYGKGSISSLQGCRVKKAKQGSLFSFPCTSSLSVYSVCLSISAALSFSQQQIQRLRCFPELCLRVPSCLCAPVTCSPFTVITALYFLVCHPEGTDVLQRNTQKDCYVNEHTFTV